MAQNLLAQLRSDRGLTQSYVAEELGITKAAFSNIETGKRIPSLPLALKLQKIFEKPIDELLNLPPANHHEPKRQ